MKNQPFWMIFNPQGNAPKAQHWTYAEAEREAERLARNNRGQKFVILESVQQFSVDDVVRVPMRPAPEDYDEIPW